MEKIGARIQAGGVYGAKKHADPKQMRVAETKFVAKDTRADHVAQIKQKIQNGDYKIDYKNTAEKVARNLLDM